jgi:Short C-terminal domain
LLAHRRIVLRCNDAACSSWSRDSPKQARQHIDTASWPACRAGSAAAASTEELLAQLERLGKLRDSGVLNEAEFQAQKARILA